MNQIQRHSRVIMSAPRKPDFNLYLGKRNQDGTVAVDVPAGEKWKTVQRGAVWYEAGKTPFIKLSEDIPAGTVLIGRLQYVAEGEERPETYDYGSFDLDFSNGNGDKLGEIQGTADCPPVIFFDVSVEKKTKLTCHSPGEFE